MPLYSFETDTMLSRLARLEDSVPYLLPGGAYAGNRWATTSAVDIEALTDGLIDLSTSGGLITAGAIPPAASEAGFAATYTDTTITWYWDGTNSSSVIVIRRTDGIRQTVPAGSITITGLTASTWYGFLPYWSPNNKCGIGWVAGTAGTPSIAFPGGTGASFVDAGTKTAQADALAQQVSIGREQLSAGVMTIQTAAGGGSGSGGAGGGGLFCVMRGTHIETLNDIAYSSKLFPQTEWRHIVTRSGKSLFCTPDHALYHPERGKVKAETLTDWALTSVGEDKVVSNTSHRRVCVKEYVTMKEGHLFWANHFLSHNSKPFS